MGVADSGTFHHVCWVVNDVDKTARALADSLSLSWQLWTIEPEVCVVRGRETRFSFRVAIAPVGDANFELLAPLSGDSVYVEHLSSRGEGFHHSCLFYGSQGALQEARDELSRQGRELIQSGGLGDLGEFHYFELPETNSILELLYLRELPPPEMTIG